MWSRTWRSTKRYIFPTKWKRVKTKLRCYLKIFKAFIHVLLSSKAMRQKMHASLFWSCWEQFVDFLFTYTQLLLRRANLSSTSIVEVQKCLPSHQRQGSTEKEFFRKSFNVWWSNQRKFREVSQSNNAEDIKKNNSVIYLNLEEFSKIL